MKSVLMVISAILLVVVVVVAVVLAVYFLTKGTADPSVVYVPRVAVTKETITLENVAFTGSAMWYVGHSDSYDNGVLTITIYARAPIRFPGDQYNGFTVSIPNTFGDIREVRLSGGSQSADKVLWSAS